MSFVHHHAPDAKPSPADVCIIVQADQLLARSEPAEVVTFPEVGQLAGWAGVGEAPLHVGHIQGRPCWAWIVEDPNAPLPVGWGWQDTRAILAGLNPAQWHAVSCARQLLWWDRRHRFCGVCGTPTVVEVEERARRCPSCGAVFFPVASPAVIVAVTRGDELLLAHNRNFRPDMFSLLAGFVDPGETLEQAVVREVREEVGITIADVRYVSSQPWSFPNSLMIGFTARYAAGELQVDGKEIHEAGWFKRTAMPLVPRPGTVARQLIDRWLGERKLH